MSYPETWTAKQELWLNKGFCLKLSEGYPDLQIPEDGQMAQ